MTLSVLEDKQVIKDFLGTTTNYWGAEFLASLEWAELLSSEEIVKTYGVYDQDKLVAVFNGVIKTIFNNLKYCYLPRGPILKSPDDLAVYLFLIKTFKEQGIIFLRVEPRDFLPAELKAQKTIDLQPKQTLMLDLTLSVEELFNNFHPKTRYNIRLAEKKKIVVSSSTRLEDFDNFWSLMKQTGTRDAFKIHGRAHYERLFSYNPEFIKLVVAKKDEQIIAAGLFSFYEGRVTYLHGASSYGQRSLMAPYLLQWSVIKQAKELGFSYYDFYGVDALKWPGVTRFKTGFGGFLVSYNGTSDLILKPFIYYLYNLLRRLRRLF